MKVILFIFSIFPLISFCEIYKDNEVLYFSDDIDSGGYEKIISLSPFEKIVIDSNGGDVDEAIKIGNYMFDHHIELEVMGKCFSSCMNYLAPSAKKFIVNEQSILMMHGGVNPQIDDWILDDVYRFKDGKISSDLLIKFMNSNFELLKNENDLYDRTGINIDIINKSSEVAVVHGCYWLLTLADLSEYGFKNIVDQGFPSESDYLEKLEKRAGEDADQFCINHDKYSWESGLTIN